MVTVIVFAVSLVLFVAAVWRAFLDGMSGTAVSPSFLVLINLAVFAFVVALALAL